MHARGIAVFALLFLAGWGDEPLTWPVAGPMPDDEAVRVPRARYVDVMAGTKDFRPVEPMPWGDVNSRVAPKPQSKPDNSGHEGH